MRTRMYGGVRGRKTKVGRKLTLFSSYSILQRLAVLQIISVFFMHSILEGGNI